MFLAKKGNANFCLVYQLNENKASGRTFIQGHSEALTYFNFFIFWSPYCFKHLTSEQFTH